MTTATAVDQLPLVTALPVEHLFDMHVNLATGATDRDTRRRADDLHHDRRGHRRAEVAR